MTREHDLTALAQEIDRELRAIRAQLRRPLEAQIARGKLTGPQQSVMQALVGSDGLSLKESDGLSLKELTVRLGLAHSTVSGIVDRLQERGLVERRVNEADKRVTRIWVTNKVRNFILKRMPELTLHPLVEAMGRANSAQRRAIVEGLKTLRNVLAKGTKRDIGAAEVGVTDNRGGLD